MARVVSKTSRKRPRGPAGFTLIELLIVVAIIATLAGILLPALTSTRIHTRDLRCRVNLKDLGVSLAIYAADHRGWLPSGPVDYEIPGPDSDPDAGSPREAYDASREEKGLRSLDGWYGLGRLWRTEVIDAGEPFYCLVAQVGHPQAATFKQSWPGRFDNQRNPVLAKGSVLIDYAYRGGLVSDANGPLGPRNALRHDPSTPMVADNPLRGAMWHEHGYNIVRIDGAVRSFSFDQPPLQEDHLHNSLTAFWAALADAPLR